MSVYNNYVYFSCYVPYFVPQGKNSVVPIATSSEGKLYVNHVQKENIKWKLYTKGLFIPLSATLSLCTLCYNIFIHHSDWLCLCPFYAKLKKKMWIIHVWFKMHRAIFQGCFYFCSYFFFLHWMCNSLCYMLL